MEKNVKGYCVKSIRIVRQTERTLCKKMNKIFKQKEKTNSRFVLFYFSFCLVQTIRLNSTKKKKHTEQKSHFYSNIFVVCTFFFIFFIYLYNFDLNLFLLFVTFLTFHQFHFYLSIFQSQNFFHLFTEFIIFHLNIYIYALRKDRYKCFDLLCLFLCLFCCCCSACCLQGICQSEKRKKNRWLRKTITKTNRMVVLDYFIKLYIFFLLLFHFATIFFLVLHTTFLVFPLFLFLWLSFLLL